MLRIMFVFPDTTQVFTVLDCPVEKIPRDVRELASMIIEQPYRFPNEGPSPMLNVVKDRFGMFTEDRYYKIEHISMWLKIRHNRTRRLALERVGQKESR